MKFFIGVFTVTFVFLCGTLCSQATYTSTQNGNWFDASTWSIGGVADSDSDGIPDRNDDVVINGHTVTTTNAVNRSKDLTINAGSILNVSSGTYIDVWGYNFLKNNGSITGSGEIIVRRGAVELNGLGSWANTLDYNFVNACEINCDIDFGGDIQVYGKAKINSGSTCTFLSGMTINCYSNYLTISYGGTLILETLNLFDLYGINIQAKKIDESLTNNGTLVYDISGSLLDLNGDYGSLTINPGITITQSFSENFKGNIINNGNYTVTAGNTISFKGDSDQSISGTGTSNINDIIITNVSPFTFGLNQNLIINGDISCSSSNLINNSVINLPNNNLTLNHIYDQTLSGTSTITFNNITKINGGGLTLTIDSLIILGVLESQSGTLSQNGTKIVLSSTAENIAGMIKVNSSSDYVFNSGNVNVQRFFNSTVNDWRMIGSPIEKKIDGSDADLSIWDDEFLYCGFTGADYSYAHCGGFCSVWFYDESNATDSRSDDGLDSATNITNSVSGAKGVLIYGSSGNNILSVTGEPEFSDISKSISRGSNNSNRGFNLISNPYPCTLGWAEFYTDNSSVIDDAFYVYDGLNNIFLSYDDDDDIDIAHSQSVYIKKLHVGSSNINFSVSQTLNTQANFHKSINGINKKLEIVLKNNQTNKTDKAKIHSSPNFNNISNPGKDIDKLFSTYPDYVSNIYILRDSNYLDKACVNNNLDVDLTLSIKSGQFVLGTHTITLNNSSEFMIGSCITLEDLETGIITDFNLDTSYTFNIDSNSLTDRFILHIDVDYDIIVSNLSCFQDSSASILFSGDSLQGSYFTVLDSLGILADSITASSDTIMFNNLNAGIYNFQTNHNGTCSKENQEIIITQPDEVIANFSVSSTNLTLDSNNLASTYFYNLSQGSNFYLWDFGDGTTSNEINPVHIYNSPGTYNVSLISENDNMGICSDTFQIEIYVNNPLVGISYLTYSKLSISYFNNQIQFSLPTEFTKFKSYKIFDLNGKVILDGYLSSKIHQLVNVSVLKPGYYIFSIFNGNLKGINEKFLKVD